MLNIKLCLLNTRPTPQNQLFAKKLDALGIKCIPFPPFHLEMLTDKSWLHESPKELNKYNWIIFTSQTAASYYLSAYFKNDYTWPKHLKIITIGQHTAQALCAYSLKVDLMPTNISSEGITELAVFQTKPQHILYVEGVEKGRNILAHALEQQGHSVSTIAVYKRTPIIYDQLFVQQLWQDNAINVILFTSEQGMRHVITHFNSATIFNWFSA